MELSIDDRVRAALIARKGEWPAIARANRISHSWISQFTRLKITNPRIQTLKGLEAYLAETHRSGGSGVAK
jgi:transcriptional regulator with XRE-family HTH domain